MVLFAVLLMMLVAMIALVLDLVSLRVDKRSDHSAADYAATAGAASMDPVFGGTPYQGCVAAWEYFIANTVGTAQGSSPCNPFRAYPSCDLLMPPVTVSKKVGDYTVTIKIPVPANAPEMDNRSDPNIDGEPCQRIAVTIDKSRTFLFAGVMKQTSGSSTITSVARSSARTSSGDAVVLIILDPNGCNALLAKGQAQVLVKSKGSFPGVIAVDSSGTETSSSTPVERRCTGAATYAIDATGTQNSSIEAQSTNGVGPSVPGVIYSYALMPGQGITHSFDPLDVATNRLKPPPIPAPPITRTPMDDAYNCSVIRSCPFADTRPPYIDNLRAQIGSSGLPAGFSLYTGPCKTTPGDPPIVLSGNYWVNCPTFDISNTVTFSSGSIVFQGNVSVGSSSGNLTINGNAVSDNFVYVRNGSISKGAQSSVTMKRTMVYIDNGYFSFGGGSGSLTWIAPTSGNFQNLALWSESSASHDLGGQASIDLEGIFFTPGAYPFRFSGLGGQYQAKAQFIVYRMEMTGQGTLIMEPDPDRMILVPLLGIRLIR